MTQSLETSVDANNESATHCKNRENEWDTHVCNRRGHIFFPERHKTKVVKRELSTERSTRTAISALKSLFGNEERDFLGSSSYISML